MLSRAASCAIALALCTSACALDHERSVHPTTAPDAASSPDAAVVADAGPIESCTIAWNGLPACPADPSGMLGARCFEEGVSCGTACCEPGPAMTCTAGVWTAAEAPDCRAVRCMAPTPCGTGSCAANRICLRSSGETIQPDRCVRAPFELTTCGDAPEGWLTTDPRSCSVCNCEDGEDARTPTITLDCPCCDF